MNSSSLQKYSMPMMINDMSMNQFSAMKKWKTGWPMLLRVTMMSINPDKTVGTDLVSVRVVKSLADGHKVRPYRMFARIRLNAPRSVGF